MTDEWQLRTHMTFIVDNLQVIGGSRTDFYDE